MTDVRENKDIQEVDVDTVHQFIINVGVPGTKGGNGAKGEKGDKGDPFKYSDFTPEQLEQLKGPKGDRGERGKDGSDAAAERAYRKLLAGNIWVNDSTVDEVFVALIDNFGKPFPRNEFKPLTVGNAVRGQKVVSITGEPHYSVKVVGNTIDVFGLNDAGIGNVTIDPLGEDDITLEYFNYVNTKVGTATIKGVSNDTDGTPDAEVTINGSVYKLFGKTLKVNATNSTATGYTSNFDFIPYEWKTKPIESIMLKSNKNIRLTVGTSYNTGGGRDTVMPGDIPVYVEDPTKIRFYQKDNMSDRKLKIGTLTAGIQQINFDLENLDWNATQNRYINSGTSPL